MQATVKVIAIALDGGTWDVLDWFIDAGYMPHLKRLKEQGTYTNLLSTCPPSTVPAWPSIVTGKNPGAQGIYGFFTRQLENYELRLTHATERKGRVFWHYLGAEGIRVGILNIPLTYPPCPVNGFLVSGMMSPTEKGISYPEDFEVELKRKFNYRVSFKTFQRTDVNFVRDLKKGVELRTKAALLMLDKGVDFLMLMFRATDLLQHKFWRELEEIFSNSKKGNAKKLKEEIIDFYSWVDECVGELVRNGGDDSIVMIFSDHGFGPRNRIVNLNNWLVKKRYLVPSRSLVSRTKYRMFRLGLTPKLAFQMVDKVKLGRIKSQAGFKNLTVRWQPKFFFSLNNIDWGRSLIYSLGAF
ncbi:MAG: alkaline phosphatase family protein, partial [Candidatus Zixiibacteriota bacterium]